MYELFYTLFFITMLVLFEYARRNKNTIKPIVLQYQPRHQPMFTPPTPPSSMTAQLELPLEREAA